MPPITEKSTSLGIVLAMACLIGLAWWWPNRPQAGNVSMPEAKFESLSFAPYRPGQSPLTNTFPTAAEVDQDLAQVATESRGIRSYSAIEGNYNLPLLARRHHLKLWLGIWLSADRAANAREMAAGIAAARAYPDVVDRVVVGNEVLLRHDLPVGELIADIDAVKRAVPEPVTTADVWEDYLRYPQLVAHLDIITVHILPYWEDHPSDLAGSMRHVQAVLTEIARLFPGRRLAIGETGWPSRGRWRRDAAPSLVNEAIYLRRFIDLADRLHVDYNFIEAFDQDWKYHNEGVVGANWGIWTDTRHLKFPLNGRLRENPDWSADLTLSLVAGLLLAALAARRGLTPLRAGMAMALGGALGFAWAGTVPVMYDGFAAVAGIGNLLGQAALAVLVVLGCGGRPRDGAMATGSFRALGRLHWPRAWRGEAGIDALAEDLGFLFLWTAAVLQVLLAYDPRYRDFPLPTFAVPLTVAAFRLVFTPRFAPRFAPHLGASLGTPRFGPLGRADRLVMAVLLGGAVVSALQEGPRNLQSLIWNAAAAALVAERWINRFGQDPGREAGAPID